MSQFFAFRSTRQDSNITPEAILNSEITNIRHRNLNRWQKDPCLQYDKMRIETNKQSIAFSDLSWGNVYTATWIFFAALPMFTNDYERTMSVDFEITNKF